MKRKIGFPTKRTSKEPICDNCNVSLVTNKFVASYFSDKIWTSEDEQIYDIPTSTHEAYCLNCYNDEIPLPMKGIKEGYVFKDVYKED